PASSSPERPFNEGADMLTLKDPILTDRPAPAGIELPPLREPELLETSPSYAPSSRGTTMTSKELAEVRSPALAPEPRFDPFGERASQMTQGPTWDPSVIPASRMTVKALKHSKSFDWVGSRSALLGVVRQLEKYGWKVTVREEGLPEQA